MQLKRMALVAGMTAAATTGLAAQAWAAPSDTSVTERQCFNGDGRVQREADGVGTCVGGTNDGLLIDDGVDHTDDGYGTSSSRSDGYGRDRTDDGESDSADRYGRASSADGDDDRSSRSTLPSRSSDTDDDLDD